MVERSQGTGKRWAEPHRAASPEELQAAIDAMDRIQRECYPYRGTESRLAAHPELEHSGRLYDPAQEPATWSLERVHELLTGYVVARQVDRCGMISVYERNYYVRKSHAGEKVFVRFDPQGRRWLFHDANDHLLNFHDAPEIDTARIQGLTVTHRRDHS